MSDAGGLILGGRFGSEPADTSFARLDRFAAAGGTLAETSYSYARGNANVVLGEWLAGHPNGVGIVTKIGHGLGGEDIPLERETVRRHTEESLDVLGIDRYDTVLYHCDDEQRPVGELADTLLGLVASGHALRVGASNWKPERLAALVVYLSDSAQTPVASYHFSLATPDAALLNPGNRYADADTLAVVAGHSLPLFSWSAQAQGFFARTDDGTHADRDPFDSPENRARRDRCRELAITLQTRAEIVALAWTLHHSDVWPSIGSTSPEHIDAAFQAARLRLTDEQATWLRTG